MRPADATATPAQYDVYGPYRAVCKKLRKVLDARTPHRIGSVCGRRGCGKRAKTMTEQTKTARITWTSKTASRRDGHVTVGARQYDIVMTRERVRYTKRDVATLWYLEVSHDGEIVSERQTPSSPVTTAKTMIQSLVSRTTQDARRDAQFADAQLITALLALENAARERMPADTLIRRVAQVTEAEFTARAASQRLELLTQIQG